MDKNKTECKLEENDSGGGDKLYYIECLRMVATLTVVFLHVVMTLPANYTTEELGVFNSAVLNCCYMPTKWAVPCFIMISGRLLLNPEKKIGINKVKKYIERQFSVLLIFGTSFSLMELVFTEKTISLMIVFQAVLNTAEGDTWSHLWYLYVLIALYFLTIPFRCVIERIGEKEFDYLILVLVIGNFVIPSVNTVLELSLKNCMILSEYATYFLVGYWLTKKRNRMGKIVFFPIILVTLLMIILEMKSLYGIGDVYKLNHQSQDVLTFVQSVGMFLLFREFENKASERKQKNQSLKGNIMTSICRCSFTIYLIHPFFINMIYKVLKITPLSFSIGLGIVGLYIVVFLLSWFSAWVMIKIPGLRRII